MNQKVSDIKLCLKKSHLYEKEVQKLLSLDMDQGLLDDLQLLWSFFCITAK